MRDLNKFARLALGSVVPAIALMATSASASAIYRYDLAGSDGSYYTWNLDSTPVATYAGNVSPSPTTFIDNVNLGFLVYDTQGTFAGYTFPNDATVGFYDISNLGGLELQDRFAANPAATTLILDGLQLYTGSYTAPTMSLGTFALTEGTSSANYNPLTTFTLVVSQPAVPEASAWAMMLAGFGMVGALLRRRVGAGRLGHVAA